MSVLRSESEMKESGIEWIGNIPSGWRIVPVLSLLSGLDAMRDGPFGSDLKNEEYTDTGVPVVQLGAIQDGKFEDKKLHYITEKKANSLLRHNAFPHDIVIAKMMPAGKAAILPEKFDRYVVSADVIKATIAKETWSKWLIYALNCYGITQCETQSQGATRSRININKAKRIKIAMPDDGDVTKCLDYLDDRCSKLDEIITEAEKSIEEYKELKQAIIAEATTKGINKQVSMKTSPFEWMGDIPSHWELKPFRYILNERNEKNNPVKSRERLSLSIDKGVTLYAEKTTNLDRFKEDFSAYKLAHEGDLVMNCMNMIVGASGVSKYYGCVSPVYYTYYDNESDHITSKYYEYLFRSRMLMRVLHSLGRGILSFDRGEDRVNTCRLKISRNDLRSLILPVPPVEEQREIVEYLTNYDEQINALISEKQSLIEDLKAYKKSLIYEVVTGKRRVV